MDFRRGIITSPIAHHHGYRLIGIIVQMMHTNPLHIGIIVPMMHTDRSSIIITYVNIECAITTEVLIMVAIKGTRITGSEWKKREGHERMTLNLDDLKHQRLNQHQN